MEVTNLYNLPESIYNVLSSVREPKDNRYGVTTLVGPPLIDKLRRKHWHEITEDASDKLWALLGTSVHYVLDKGAPDAALGEEKLELEIAGATVVGISDLYHDGIISDYKVTSVFAFLLGDKPEWEAQLNIYRYMWERNGFPVNALQIHAILRDWSKGKSLSNRDYPRIPFQTTTLPLWTMEKTERYIKQRIDLHRSPFLFECTPEEKWERPTKYAVMKKGRKSAVRVLDSESEALDYVESKQLDHNHYIEVRPGECVRCENYCNVKDFCPYYNERKQEEGFKDVS